MKARGARLPMLLSMGALFYLGAYTAGYAVLAGEISRLASGSVAGLGVLGVLQSAGALVSPVLAGLMVDRFGTRRTGVWLLLLIFCGLAVCTFSPLGGLLYAAILFVGAAGPPIDTVAAPIVARLYPDDASKITLAHSFYSIGGIVAPLGVRYLISIGSYRAAFAAFAVLALALTAGFFLFLRPAEAAPCQTHTVDFSVLRSGRFLLLLVSAFCYYCVVMGMSYWVTPYFEALGSGKGALGLTLFWVAALLARWAASVFKRACVRMERYLYLLTPALLSYCGNFPAPGSNFPCWRCWGL